MLNLSSFNLSFGDKISATLGYTRGLDTLSYDHIVSLKLGVNFE